jgi:hypothetical protein
MASLFYLTNLIDKQLISKDCAIGSNWGTHPFCFQKEKWNEIPSLEAKLVLILIDRIATVY